MEQFYHKHTKILTSAFAGFLKICSLDSCPESAELELRSITLQVNKVPEAGEQSSRWGPVWSFFIQLLQC